MNECLAALISALAATALARLISFSGDNERWVRFALGVVLSAAVATLIIDTVEGITLFDGAVLPEYEHYGGTYASSLEDAFCEGVANAVCEDFSLARADLTVSVVGFDIEKVRAEKITVKLFGRAVGCDTRKLRAYLEERFGESEVILNFE